jgi:hypothetical protein
VHFTKPLPAEIRRQLFEIVADLDQYRTEHMGWPTPIEEMHGYPSGWGTLPRRGAMNTGAMRAQWFPVPLWPVILMPTLVCGWGWWRAMAARTEGHCPACNYDLSGLLPGSSCPECAAKPPAPPHHRHRGPHP